MFKKVLLLCPFVFSSAAFASGDFYVGGSVGVTHPSANLDAGTGLDDGNSFTLTGGYWLAPNLAFEISYTDFGDNDVLGYLPAISFNATGVSYSAVGYYPFTSKLDGFAKLGAITWNVNIRDQEGTSEFGVSNGTQLHLALGLSYEISDKLNAIAEVQRNNFNGNGLSYKLSNLSIGARYHF